LFAPFGIGVVGRISEFIGMTVYVYDANERESSDSDMINCVLLIL
jgi:hypothetical protein